MPRLLSYENRHKTPAAALLLLTNLFIQLVLILTLLYIWAPREQGKRVFHRVE